ncbi:MAG: ATP-binding cassette domain-containing protein [Candidatus Hydrothermales bacterium]
MIKVKEVYKRFSDWVLEDINFEVYDGEFVIILGKSGVGKSVLFKIMVGLLKPERGYVFYDNLEITKTSEKDLIELRKKIGFVFQGSALFDSMTLFENVALPLREHFKLTKKEIEYKVLKAIEAVDLRGFENLYPSELSGGMKKRGAIARAIVHDPDYIFYDEPTTGLDPETADKITNLIKRLWEQRGITSLAVTHDFNFSKAVATKIIWLYNKRVRFVGTIEEFQKLEDKEARAYFID